MLVAGKLFFIRVYLRLRKMVAHLVGLMTNAAAKRSDKKTSIPRGKMVAIGKVLPTIFRTIFFFIVVGDVDTREY